MISHQRTIIVLWKNYLDLTVIVLTLVVRRRGMAATWTK